MNHEQNQYIFNLIDNHSKIDEISRSIILGIGRIEGTKDIYLERYIFKLGGEPLKKHIIASATIENIGEQIEKNDENPMFDRYISAVEKNYKSSFIFRKEIHPIIDGFVKPLSSKEITFTIDDYEYRKKYYLERNDFNHAFEDESDEE